MDSELRHEPPFTPVKIGETTEKEEIQGLWPIQRSETISFFAPFHLCVFPEVRKEMNHMQQNTTDKCARLSKLHDRLIEELRALKETREEMEQESFDNPIETVSVIKSLQGTLNTIENELTKCPAE